MRGLTFKLAWLNHSTKSGGLGKKKERSRITQPSFLLIKVSVPSQQSVFILLFDFKLLREWIFLSFYYIKLIYRNETVYACLKQNYLLNAFQKCMALRTVVNHNTIALSLSQLYFNWSNKLPQNIFIFNQFSPEEIMKMPDIRTINPSSSIRKSSSFIHFTFHKHR